MSRGGIWFIVFVCSIVALVANAQVKPILGCRTVEEFRRAIESGADVNAVGRDGWSVLMGAAYSNPDPRVCDLLISAGARVDFTEPGGTTPLMVAVQHNPNLDVIRSLLKGGANPNVRDEDGRTALMDAVFGPNPAETITILLDAGADPKVNDRARKNVPDLIRRFAPVLVDSPVYNRLLGLLR